MWKVNLEHEGAPRWFCSDYCQWKDEIDNMIELNEVYVNCIEEKVIPLEFISLKIDNVFHNGVIYNKVNQAMEWRICCKITDFQDNFKREK
jgi:hypothetical protein